MIDTLVVAAVAKLLLFFIEVGPKIFMTNSEYGKYSYFLIQTALLSNVISYGGQNLIIKNIKSNDSEYKKAIFEVNLISLIFSLVIFALAYLLDIDMLVVMSSITIALLINTVTYYRGVGKTKFWYLFKDISKSVVFICVFFAILLTLGDVSAFSASVSYIVAGLVSLMFLSKILIYIDSESFKDFSKNIIKNTLERIKVATPIIFMGFTYMLLSRIDSFFVKDFLGFEALGDYTTVSRIMYQILFFQQVFIAAKLHVFSKLFKEHNYNKAINKAKTLTNKVSLVTLLTGIVVIYVINLNVILDVLKLKDIFELSIVFFVTHLIYTKLCLNGYFLFFSNKQYYGYLNSIIIMLTSVILNVKLIPILGLPGAAIATGGSILLGNVLEFIQFKFLVYPNLKSKNVKSYSCN
ncbi:oligosaccharide flippase family protein [Vibrio harveyi]|uniref:oligosaccharide flippase family protein n=1 Tax=Vibrio harveyi TaxID=669 RepID=UPI00066B5C7F|nr:oligosaccharide flippase family protein [Vibrio harveyi]